MSLDQIGKDVGLFGEELEEFLKPLIEKELIRMIAHNSFSITDRGKQFLAEIWPVVEQTNQTIFKNFSPEEKQQFSDFLQRIQQSCTDIIGK